MFLTQSNEAIPIENVLTIQATKVISSKRGDVTSMTDLATRNNDIIIYSSSNSK